MDKEQAELILSNHENISITALTLSALDTIQSDYFHKNIEDILIQNVRHSESQVADSVGSALRNVCVMSPIGNGHGFKMNVSVFVNGLNIVKLDKLSEMAMISCSKFETLSSND